MAKKWIKKATANAHGQFRAKAEHAGETTREFAKEHEHDRLAEALMGLHKKSSGSAMRKKMYGTKSD